MRVIAGEYKRRELKAPAGDQITRPTTDRVKENIFNLLPSCEGKIILDLFAGSGALGIEALSRGAKKAFFVEENAIAKSFIQRNLTTLGVHPERYTLIQQKVSPFLASGKNAFALEPHIIFTDPPYQSGWYEQALQELEESGICQTGCLVVFEMPRQLEVQQSPQTASWSCAKSRQYGRTKIEIWSRS